LWGPAVVEGQKNQILGMEEKGTEGGSDVGSKKKKKPKGEGREGNSELRKKSVQLSTGFP